MAETVSSMARLPKGCAAKPACCRRAAEPEALKWLVRLSGVLVGDRGGAFLNLLVQNLTLRPPHLGFNSQKGRLQPREIADLLVADLPGAGGHLLHEVGALRAEVLNQSREIR